MNQVNHPSHYKQEGRRECIIEMREKYGQTAVAWFCLTNAYKYLYRAGNKEGNSYEQDIAKARWYRDYLCNSGWFNSAEMHIPDHMSEMWKDINRQLRAIDDVKPWYQRIVEWMKK